jgi:hypothetical protein
MTGTVTLLVWLDTSAQHNFVMGLAEVAVHKQLMLHAWCLLAKLHDRSSSKLCLYTALTVS